METVWSEISLSLAQVIENAQHKVWIAPLKASYKNGELSLVARNDFVAKFVRSHYHDIILQAATAVLGEAPQLVIKAASSGEAVHLNANSALAGEASELASHRPEQLVRENFGANSLMGSHTFKAAGLERSGVAHANAAVMQEQSGAFASNQSFASAAFAASVSGQSGASATGKSSSSAARAEQSELPLSWTSNEFFNSAQSHRLVKSWRYNFDDFVVGQCNELAHAAARSVCENHSNFGSVLFLCSEAGLGKTHLMQAVGANLVQASNFSAPRIEYLSAEEFANHMRQALRSNEMDRFKARFRAADVLLLEDVHFLQEKAKTQDELLATLSALLDKGSKVVFSSSFAPRELKIDGQLLSRLGSGMIANMQRPDKDTRRRIISNKASSQKVRLSDDVTDYLAETMNVDIRQIESCIQNLALKARFFNRAITLDMARDTVSNYLDTFALVNLPEIVRMVCEGFGVSPDTLNSKSRKHEYVQARNTVFYLARKHTSLSLQEIGQQFSRTHSTVIKGITSLEREISRQSHSGRQLASAISLIEKRGKMPSLHS